MANPPLLPNVRPSGAQPGTYQDHNPSPGAFGMHRARALQEFGQTVEQGGLRLFEAAERRRKEANNLMLTDAESTLARRLAVGYGEFGNRLGKSAQEGLNDYQSNVDRIYAEVAATLPDDESRERFNASTRNMRDSYWVNGLTHADGQMDVWNTETTKSVSAEMTQQAVLAGTNFEMVRDSVRKGADAIMEHNQSLGIDADMAGREVRKYIGDSYFQVIKSLVDQGKIADAERVFNEFKGEMNAENIVKAQTTLSGPLRLRQARIDVDGVTNPYAYRPEEYISRNEYVIGDSHGDGIRRAANLQGWTKNGASITSPEVRQQLQNVPEGSRAFVSLGTNDLASPRSMDTVLASAREIMADAKARNIDLVWLGPPTSDKAWNERAAELDEGLAALADEYGVEYRSMQESTRDLTRAPDGVHYTPEGYRTMFGNSAASARGDVSAYVPLPAYMPAPERRTIATVAPTLQHVIARAAQIAEQNGHRIHIPQTHSAGRRSREEQAEHVRAGNSRTMDSHHLRGDAIDIWPVRPDGRPDADWVEGYAYVGQAMRQAAQELGVELTWGGDWSSFVDRPHWQLGPNHRSRGGVPTGPVAQIITTATQRYGEDVNVMLRIAQLESGGNPNAKNPASSAGGLYQFIDSTAAQYGLTNKFDAAQNADAGARLLRDNRAGLRSSLAREPEGWELYLAHQQGLGGAKALLADPNRSVVDAIMAGDPGISREQAIERVTLNGGNMMMTAGAFAQKWRDRYNGADGTLGNYSAGGAPTSNAIDAMQAAAAGVPPTGPSITQVFQAAAGGVTDVPLPEPRAPVQYGMPDKGEALQRLMAETAGDPARQDAAIIELNRRYSEWETATATQRAELTQSSKDMIEAAGDGVSGITFPEDQIRYYFPPQKAEAIIAEFQIAQGIGQVMQSARWASPAEIQSLNDDVHGGEGYITGKIDELFPTDGSVENYRLREQAVNEFDQMMEKRTAALEKDPAAYVQQEPMVTAARQRLQADPSITNWRSYAETVLAVQEHLGLSPEQRHIMTQTEATNIASKITDPAQSAVAFMAQQQKIAGPLWNQYFTDLAGMGGLPTEYQMLALLPEEKDAIILERGLRDMAATPDLTWDKVLGQAPEGAGLRTTEIDTAVMENDPRLEQYLQSQINSNGEGARDMVKEVVSSIQTLAYSYAFYKRMDSVTAARTALDAFLNQFEFMPGNAVIPKENAPRIYERVDKLMDMLRPEMLELPPGIGDIEQPAGEELLRNVRSTPMWITNQMSDGMYLVNPATGAPLRWRDGRMVEVPFAGFDPMWESPYGEITVRGPTLGVPPADITSRDMLRSMAPPPSAIEQSPATPLGPEPPAEVAPEGWLDPPTNVMGVQ